MIIECKTCHARFRLDESKIKGRGARVKCRKCGEQIVVLKETDSGTAAQAREGEGSLDLGSALREPFGESALASRGTPHDNLIPFPTPAARSVEPPEPAGKDEVDIAFEQLLARTPETPAAETPEEPAPAAPPEEPAAPSFEAPPELTFETPPELTFEAPAAPPFEPPSEPTFDTPAASVEEPSVPTFEPPAEPGFEAPAALSFEPTPESAKEDIAPKTPAGETTEWTIGEGTLEAAGEEKFDLPLPREEERPPEIGEGTDISLSIAPSPVEPEPEFALEATAFPAQAEGPPAPSSEEISVEGNVTPPPVSQEIDIPPQPEEEPAAALLPPDEPAERQAPARSGPSPALVAGIAVLLLLLAAAGFFGFTGSGKRLLGNIAPGITALLDGEGAGTAVSRYEVKNVIGYYDSGAASPRILVIKGQVANLSSAGKSGIRVFASLLDNTGTVLVEQVVYAGNILSGEMLKKGDRATLEKTLVNPLGEHLANMDVPPGKAIPFMVLFFDAPENIDSYKLEAKDTQ